MQLIAAITVAMFGGLAVFAWFYWFYNYTQREAYASSLTPPAPSAMALHCGRMISAGQS